MLLLPYVSQLSGQGIDMVMLHERMTPPQLQGALVAPPAGFVYFVTAVESALLH